MKKEEAIECIRAIHVQMFNSGNSKWTEACNMAIEALKEKRPHGEWITEPHSRIIHCSNCCAEENRNKLYLAKWCYSCGADMRPREGDAE